MMKKYSVLMSVYIKENPVFFRESMDSMLNQSLKPDEIVVIEDGKLTKELYEVLDEYELKYKCVKRYVNDNNIGLGLSLKRGVLLCENEYIARMDTDDIAVLERCERQVDFLNQNKNVSIVGGQICEFVETTNNIVGKRVVPENNDQIQKFMKKRCPFNHMTVMFRKSSVLSAGNYRDFFYNEDYDLWIRMMNHNLYFANLPDSLVYVRTTPDLYKRRGGVNYFKSEYRIQKQLFSLHIIGIIRFLINISIRLCVQVLMPNSARKWFFILFARKKRDGISI